MLVARAAFRVVVISEGLRDAYIAKGIDVRKIVVAHDASSLDFSNALSQADARARLGLSHDGKVALYVGRIDASKGVPVLAAAAEHTSARVVVIGDGPLKSELQEKYPQVTFLPPTAYEDLPNVLPAADVLVIPNSAKDDDTALYTSPMKYFAYRASGIPLIVSDVPALRVIADESVMFVPADDPEALGKGVGAVVNRGGTIAQSGSVHSWSHRAKTIIKSIS